MRICEMGGAHSLAPSVPRVVCVSLMYQELVFASFVSSLYRVCVDKEVEYSEVCQVYVARVL